MPTFGVEGDATPTPAAGDGAMDGVVAGTVRVGRLFFAPAVRSVSFSEASPEYRCLFIVLVVLRDRTKICAVANSEKQDHS
tara:strand:- start:116 stop:358 length:243 start_codon:yes stop_codon:yes gene_type:complete